MLTSSLLSYWMDKLSANSRVRFGHALQIILLVAHLFMSLSNILIPLSNLSNTIFQCFHWALKMRGDNDQCKFQTPFSNAIFQYFSNLIFGHFLFFSSDCLVQYFQNTIFHSGKYWNSKKVF